jgi:anthranilate synthase component 1
VTVTAQRTHRAVELIPVTRERLADLETPVSAFAKLRSLGGAFLLESAEGGERMGRYSFIGVAPRAVLHFYRDGQANLEWRDEQLGAGAEEMRLATISAPDPLRTLREHLSLYRRQPSAGLPRFSGGAVGFVGYEAARRFERLPIAANDPYAPFGLPDMVFGIYDTVVAFDHLRHTLTVLAHDEADRPGGAARMIDQVFSALDAPLPPLASAAGAAPEIRANGTPEEFKIRVSRARELIAEGDCIQIVLAQRFDLRPAPDALALYRALRHVNPSPYMFLLETASATLVGASPARARAERTRPRTPRTRSSCAAPRRSGRST